MIVGLGEVDLEGSRLERVVLDRRFGQLILFLKTGAGGTVEVMYHRVDLELMSAEHLERLSAAAPRVELSELRSGQPQEHRLSFDLPVQLLIRYQDAKVLVTGEGQGAEESQ